MAKPTLKDIAARAGVGTATVERVLNGRGSVKAATAERVIAAAKALDAPRRMPDLHRGIFRIEVLLPRADNAFFRRMSRAFERVAATLEPSVQIMRTYVDFAEPEKIAARIARPELRRSGLILAVPDHKAVRVAVQQAAAEGVHMIHVVTRVGSDAVPLIGIDNIAAGRTAAQFMATMQHQGGTVVAIGDPIYRVHQERLLGFSDYFRARPRDDLSFCWIGFGRDDPSRVTASVNAALRDFPDLTGIYNVGAANSAVEAALVKAGRAGKVFFVGHELSDNSEAALRRGHMHIVIDQNPEAQVRRAVDWLLFRFGLSDTAPDPSSIRFVTFTDQSI